MYKGKKILGLIPARGGSKGIPKKNIKLLAGKPLIAWTIEQALNSKYLDKVLVSTDDKEIAEISKKYKAEVPFLRPKELAADEAKSIDVIIHALDFLKAQGLNYDYLMLLEPTSPLRETQDIDRTIEILSNNKRAKAIVSVAKLESTHPEFNVIIDKSTGCIRKMDGTADFRALRRQELQDVFFFEGTIYLSEVDTLLAKRTFYHEKTLPYIVPRWKSLEIDEMCDLVCAEALLKAQTKGCISRR